MTCGSICYSVKFTQFTCGSISYSIKFVCPPLPPLTTSITNTTTTTKNYCSSVSIIQNYPDSQTSRGSHRHRYHPRHRHNKITCLFLFFLFMYCIIFSDKINSTVIKILCNTSHRGNYKNLGIYFTWKLTLVGLGWTKRCLGIVSGKHQLIITAEVKSLPFYTRPSD